MARVICLKPCPPQGPLSITIPLMGSVLSAGGNLSLSGGCSGCEAVGNLMNQLGPTLSSLGLPLCVLGCAGALVGFANAVSAALGPPPDPTKLVTALENILTQCQCVVGMALPPPVGPICDFLKLTRDMTGMLSSVTSCLTGLLTHLVTLNVRSGLMLGDLNPAVVSAGQCLQTQVQAMTDQLGGKMQGFVGITAIMGPIFTLLQSLLPSQFGTAISNLTAGMSAFTGSIPAGTIPSDFLTSVTTLSNTLTEVYSVLQTLAMVCP